MSRALHIGHQYTFDLLGGRAKYLGPRYDKGSTDVRHRFRMLEDGKLGVLHEEVSILHSELWEIPCATPSTSGTSRRRTSRG